MSAEAEAAQTEAQAAQAELEFYRLHHVLNVSNLLARIGSVKKI
jgi:hypothetical protein